MTNPLEDRGIIPYLMGGLGNQMFTMAAGFVTAKVQNCPLWLPDRDVTDNKHNKHALNYKDTIFKYAGMHTSMQEKPLINYCLASGYRLNTQIQSGFHPWDPKTISAGSILHDYYQYYPALEPFENELRAVYLKGLEETSQRLLQLFNVIIQHFCTYVVEITWM